MRGAKTHPKLLLLTAPLLLLASLAGCGKFFTDDTGGGGTTGNYLYVANSANNSVAAFSLSNSTGKLTALNGSNAYSVNGSPSSLAATPAGTFLYVGGLNGAIFVYSIATDGTLTAANNGQAVATGFTPASLAIDSTGQWLFAVDSNATAIFVYQINATTGVLTSANPATVPLDPGSPKQVYLAPNNQFLYVALGTGGVDIFTFNSTTGALANRANLAANRNTNGANQDVAVRANSTSQFLYVAESNVGVRALRIGTNSALTELSGSPFSTTPRPAALALDSTGAYLYVANQDTTTLSGFAIGVNGALIALSSSPFTAGTAPNSMTLDQSGKYLAVVSGGGSPDLQIYSFDATTGGKLDPVSSANTGTTAVSATAVVSAK